MTTSIATRLGPMLLACLLSVASAQIDAASQELLDGLAPTTGAALISLDQTMVTTILQPGQDPIVARTRTVVDFVNERAAILSEMGQGMSTRMVYVDGKATMSIPGMPMTMPAPPELASGFAVLFDPPTVTDDPNAKAVYDGVVRYGDVVTGQQVSYTGTYAVAGTATDSTVKYLFDDAGAFIATVSEAPEGGQTIMVFDGPVGDPRVGRDATLYSFDGTTGTLTSTIAFENVRLDEPLDETLFD